MARKGRGSHPLWVMLSPLEAGSKENRQSILGGKCLHQEVVMGINMADKEQHGEEELALVSVALMVMTI